MIEAPTKALSYWPEWCPSFRGVRFRDGEASLLDKPCENRPNPPWSTIAPRQDPCAGFMTGAKAFLPGPWVAMHAGKHIGGRPGNDGALGAVIDVAVAAGWRAYVPTATDIRPPRLPDSARLWRTVQNADSHVEHVDLHPARIVTSAIVAVFRVTRADPPGVGGPWRFAEQWGWYVEVLPLVEPVPCRGAQGLWTIPADVRARIRIAA